MKHCQQMHYWYSSDELSDRRIDSKTEVMELKCPCGNARCINDPVLWGQTLVHIGVLLLAV